jgi:putative DNA primase/helicase
MIPRSTVERAAGRWKEILPALGLSPSYFTGKHGPCPLCGGKDRFRFDDKAGSGSYICSQCGAGYGINLLQKLRGWDFRTACVEVDRLLGNEAPRHVEPRKESRHRWMHEQALKRATDSAVLAAYLAERGLSVSSDVLRGDPACAWFDESGCERGKFPAVIAPILSLDGELQSVQRVYMADLPARKKVAPPVSTINGAAVRLQPPAEEMGVCEGWETGLACHQMTGLPIWAALSENGLQQVELPPLVRKLHIFGDNDRSFVGQAAAFIRAKRAVRDKLEAEVHIPESAGDDWLDVLNREPSIPWAERKLRAAQ